MALSILGFNLGIEVMQLFVIALIIPWLMLLSRTAFYKWFRTAGAVLAGVAALAWIAQRTTGKNNITIGLVELTAQYAIWGIVALPIVTIGIYLASTPSPKKQGLYPDKLCFVPVVIIFFSNVC